MGRGNNALAKNPTRTTGMRMVDKLFKIFTTGRPLCFGIALSHHTPGPTLPYPFHKHSLSSHPVPGTILSAKDTPVNRKDNVPTLVDILMKSGKAGKDKANSKIDYFRECYVLAGKVKEVKKKVSCQLREGN